VRVPTLVSRGQMIANLATESAKARKRKGEVKVPSPHPGSSHDEAALHIHHSQSPSPATVIPIPTKAELGASSMLANNLPTSCPFLNCNDSIASDPSPELVSLFATLQAGKFDGSVWMRRFEICNQIKQDAMAVPRRAGLETLAVSNRWPTDPNFSGILDRLLLLRSQLKVFVSDYHMIRQSPAWIGLVSRLHNDEQGATMGQFARSIILQGGQANSSCPG
jgi:hypothetical protein